MRFLLDPDRIHIRRNRSWPASIALGLTVAVFYAPLHLGIALREPIMGAQLSARMLIASLFNLAIGVFAWIAVRLIYLVAGILGFVSIRPAE